MIENSLIYSGVGDKLRNIPISLGENTRKTGDLLLWKTFQKFDELFGNKLPFKPFTKKLYGLKDNIRRFSLDTLACDWLGFLKGEPLYLPENELTFRSNGVTIPDREMGEYVMRAFLKKGSPYLQFGKLDDLLDVDVIVDESSAHVSYFRRQKVNPAGKVLMRCKFGMTIQLKKPLESFDTSVYDNMPFTPYDCDKLFYGKIKGILEQHEKFCYVDKGLGFIIKKAESEGEANARFALNLAADGSNNFFKFMKYWMFANPVRPETQILKNFVNPSETRYECQIWSDTATRYYFPLIKIESSENTYSDVRKVKLGDFENCLNFVCSLTSQKLLGMADYIGYGSSVRRKFGCVVIHFGCDSKPTFDGDFCRAKEQAIECLKSMMQIFVETEEFIKTSFSDQWKAFSEDSEIYSPDGFEIPDLDKYGAMLVAQTICLDPLMYADEKGDFGNYAHSHLVGDFYNG